MIKKHQTIILSLTFLFFLLIHQENCSTEPFDTPILQLETGMHTAVIRRISVDSANRYLVTASDDKTIRVWELSSGRHLKTLRPPIGFGNSGKIYAVAISPDGSSIACGGYTDEFNSIYIFYRETGRIVKRIQGLPIVVNHLVYSPDGRFLAVSLSGKYGMRVYSTRDYSLVSEDTDYGFLSYGADFDRNGRLATTSDDGFIRLYDRETFTLIAKEESPGGTRPYQVSFSPDGSKIAVGYSDKPAVNILSGEDLTFLYSLDTSDIPKNRNLGRVTWSVDGTRLFGGGQYYKKGCIVRIWEHGEHGAYRDVPVADNTIMHILPLNNGGAAYGAFDPAFGIIDSNGKRSVFKGPAIADFRNNKQNFLVSWYGDIVQFCYEKFGKSPVRFSVKNRQIETTKPIKDLSPPKIYAPGMVLNDWENSYYPKLNGKLLKLDRNETSRCCAITPNMKNVLIGTEWHLRLFSHNGQELWNVSTPAVAWSVNVAGSNRVAVVAYGDGSIRWHRMSDGREILAFFPHNDKKRWVLWTPSGFFDASPGADDLIGWHVNNGIDREADFFPVGRFREVRYRPDIIEQVLVTLNEVEAVKIADEKSGRQRILQPITAVLPPVVTIVSPSDFQKVAATEVPVRYTLRSPSGEPVTGIRVLVDGRPASIERGIQKVAVESDEQVLWVRIPERDCRISVIAENRYAASVPATVRIIWTGRARQDDFVIKPKLYILAIGVSSYDEKDISLQFPAKDARDFAIAMNMQSGGLYRDIIVKVLTDGKATKGNILDALDWIQHETTSKDVAMVFLAGHGVNNTEGIYYFLPSDTELDHLKRTGIPSHEIKNTVSALAGKALFFVDTCHSGNVMGRRRDMADINAFVNELTSAETGAVVFASSTGKQYSLENPAWNNGAFTKALVEGVSGRADYIGDGRITINMLDLYLSERVKELTDGKQTPTTTKPETISDFPIALIQ